MTDQVIQVLLIEDDPGDVRPVQEMLCKESNQRSPIVHVCNLTAGLEKLAGNDIDAVLLDLALLDGKDLDALLAIQEQAPGIPVIALAGKFDEVRAMSALLRGAQDCLVEGDATPESLGRAIRFSIERQGRQKQRIASERLAVLGKLAGGLGHELRNPLGVIQNAAELLQMILPQPDEEIDEVLQIIERKVRECDSIIDSLLSFARPRRPELRPLDIRDVIEQALQRQPIPANVKVVTRFAQSPDVVMADPGQLSMVFGNLIRNAIQAMPDGGRLAIEGRHVVDDETGAEWLAITCSDNGTGIPPEHLKRLFEPLYTTKARGIGLGLALCQMMVERHGGSIQVQSEVGKGSILTVKLPLARIGDIDADAMTQEDGA